ncbi:snRNA-activating protein complex subunit 1-like [Scomber japonicus]|uniref:snRNA-activating protein complex subunit 1-like n=1 Tax=Scomber japonicus TaxID=13676 RepID=UPI0023067F02|nr:snRNA-activating protein complex subunit 1-like [Scomber japonicus]
MPCLPPIYSDFFFQPLTEDVEELLARFQQADTVRYEEFSAIWRQMGFSDVFRGITNIGEMRRFCRVALNTAVKYFMPPYSYQIRVGGLYLMFGFYNTQLAIPPVRIRLALKDWDQVQRFIKDSVDFGHHDVVYIYQKLISIKAINYTAMPLILTFQKQKKPKQEPVCAEFIQRSTVVQEFLSVEILEELANLQSHYEMMKETTEGVGCLITMTHQNFAARLRGCMSEFITWQQKTFSQDNKDDDGKDEDEDEDEEKSAEVEASSRARLLCSIKQKSYSNYKEASKSRRHRQGETVDSSSSGPEQIGETGTRVGRRKKPPSLRARTWKSLGMIQEESKVQAWLLTAPEQDSVPTKMNNKGAPSKPLWERKEEALF